MLVKSICYLHRQLARRCVAAAHVALGKYAHILSLILFEIAGLLFVFDIAICLNNDIWTGGQLSVIVLRMCVGLCTFVALWCAFVDISALWIYCFEALRLLELNVRLIMLKIWIPKAMIFSAKCCTIKYLLSLCLCGFPQVNNMFSFLTIKRDIHVGLVRWSHVVLIKGRHESCGLILKKNKTPLIMRDSSDYCRARFMPCRMLTWEHLVPHYCM